MSILLTKGGIPKGGPRGDGLPACSLAPSPQSTGTSPPSGSMLGGGVKWHGVMVPSEVFSKARTYLYFERSPRHWLGGWIGGSTSS